MAHAGLPRIALALAALALASCARGTDTVIVTVEQDGRVLRIQAEVADSAEERFRGLRGREQLVPGTGMVFLFADIAVRTFTMEDVTIPLDLLVIRQGRVIEVFEMTPCRGDPENCLYRTLPADAALEIPGGAAAAAGIGAGALVDIPGRP